jgi:hypothetical protein
MNVLIGKGDYVNGNKIGVQNNYFETVDVAQLSAQLKEFLLKPEAEILCILTSSFDAIKDQVHVEEHELMREHYPSSDLKDWKPFKNDKSISELVIEFSEKVRRPIVTLLIDCQQELNKDLIFTLEMYQHRIIWVTDSLSLLLENNAKEAEKYINKHQVGGCLLPFHDNLNLCPQTNTKVQMKKELVFDTLLAYFKHFSDRCLGADGFHDFLHIDLEVRGKNHFMMMLSRIFHFILLPRPNKNFNNAFSTSQTKSNQDN